MLLEGHYLEGVVAQVLDIRQDIFPEFIEGGHLLLLRAHAYVALIYKGMPARPRLSVLPSVRLVRSPHLCAEDLGFRVLDSPCGICRKPFPSASGPLDIKLVELSVAEEHRIEADFPVPVPDRMKGIRLGLSPVVELPDQVYLRGIRSPFTEHPRAVAPAVQPVVQMVVHRIGEGAVPGNPLPFVKNPPMPPVYGLLVRNKPRISVINHCFLRISHSL